MTELCQNELRRNRSRPSQQTGLLAEMNMEQQLGVSWLPHNSDRKREGKSFLTHISSKECNDEKKYSILRNLVGYQRTLPSPLPPPVLCKSC